MKIVVFGLTISSSWGNGHATLWRGLCRSLGRLGHRVVFFERDVPYYASHRDATSPPGCDLRLYSDWEAAIEMARRELEDADAAIVTSYCPDGIAASELVLSGMRGTSVFYDMDTPVTLARRAAGEVVPYLPPQGLGDFDLVLSFTGGRALDRLRSELGARRVAPLYGSVDPLVHHRVARRPELVAALSHIGTYSEDRRAPLEALFLEPAKRSPAARFVIAGSMYPESFPWTENTYYVRHLAPGDHAAFYSSSRITLNVTRAPMARLGHCPSGRIFEAAACCTPILTDDWEGIDHFFEPGREILVARTTEEALAALSLSDEELAQIAERAEERVEEEHTSDIRALDLVEVIEHPPPITARTASGKPRVGRDALGG